MPHSQKMVGLQPFLTPQAYDTSDILGRVIVARLNRNLFLNLLS